MATPQHLKIMDNNALDSSMDSTSNLLSFMTNASRQIKTYLGPEKNPKSQKKQKRQQLLLQQLTQLQSQNFIPDILTSSEYCSSTPPASPTPSLDSVGSMDDESPARPSCLLSNRRKRASSSSLSTDNNKRARQQSIGLEFNNQFNTFSIDYDLNTIIPSINTAYASASYKNMQHNNEDNDNYDIIIPSPSPDFDDLVDCMLTEDSLSNINVNNYFPSL